MKRAALEQSHTLRTWRRHLARHSGGIQCRCEFQVGRFRKGQRVGGCGIARCWTCHAEKLSGEPTLDEERASVSLREGLAELY